MSNKTTPASPNATNSTSENFYMEYRNAQRLTCKEPACESCIDLFGLSCDERRILERARHFVWTFDGYLEARFAAFVPEESAYVCRLVHYLDVVVKPAVEQARGLFCMNFEDIQLLTDALYLAIAAEFLTARERDEAIKMQGKLESFREHLRCSHQGEEQGDWPRALSLLDPTHCVGSVTLDKAFLLAPEIRGRREELEDVLERHITEDIRRNLAEAHRPRKERSDLMSQALRNTLTVIRDNSQKWNRIAQHSANWHELYKTAEEVFVQLSVVDELLEEIRLYGDGEESLYYSIDTIRDLVDWADCPRIASLMQELEPIGAD